MKLNSERSREAQILKALAHPIRLYIVEILLKGETCVNDLKELFDVTQPNISQHLNVLRYSGVADFRQDGNLRCYFLIDPERIKLLIQIVKGIVSH
jgi:ArsR family transcriptional regulator